MSKLSKTLIPALILLLTISVAYASNLTITTIKDQISPYDFATYGVSIYNSKPYPDKYTFSVRDIRWSVQTEPLTDYTTGFDVGGYGTSATILMLKPQETINFGIHDIAIELRGSNETLTKVVSVNVRQDLIKYPFDVGVQLSAPEIIDPRKTASVKVALNNNNLLSIKNLSITLKSSIFEKSTIVDLDAGTEKIIDFSILLDPSMPYKKDRMIATVKFNGSIVKETGRDFEVMPFPEIFKKTVTTTNSFLKTVTMINYLNDASSKRSQDIVVNTALISRLFTSTDPDMDVEKINGTYYYTKAIELAPGQSYNVIVSTNYRPLLYAIILLVAAAIMYLVMRSPIIIKKEASDIEIAEGGISRLKVVIKIKNRSNETIKNVRLVDRIPHIAAFEVKGAETLKPTKVFPYREGTVLSYTIPKIEPNVVLIVTYDMKTKLGVVGDFRLKPAIVQFYNRRTYSNAVDVYTP